MVSSLRIDFETRSTVDLKKTGVYPYAEHPTTDIWCMAWAFDEEEPEIWTPHGHECDDMPTLCRYCEWAVTGHECLACGGGQFAHLPGRVIEHIQKGGEVRAWNAQFERVIWREIMVKRYGAPEVQLHQWVCSAAEAAAMALPRALGQAADTLGVAQQKDDKGYRQMLQMSRPRKIEDDGTITWWDVPAKLETLYAYCKQDVRTESSIVKSLRRLTPREREIYLLDQRMNDRGIAIDRPLILAAQHIADVGVERANLVMREITGGQVTSVMKYADLKTWLLEQGVPTAGVSKAAVKELLEGDLAENVRAALEAKADAGRTSVAKLKSLLEAASGDDRVRGMLLYHGAGTGRWAGRGPQPHNFPRGEVKDVESYIPATMAMQYDMLDLFHHPIVLVSSMLRSMLTAAPGHELMAGDYAAIEARVLNWIADQADVVESFRQYDRASKADKPKFDPYRRMAVKMGRGTSPELVTAQDRQAGKAAELGCGFQMGADKFITAAWDVYQVRVNEEQSREAVNIYRESHPKVKQLWYDAQNAVKRAIEKPGEVQTFGGLSNLRALVSGPYLLIILPSGRALHYAAPKIVLGIAPWSKPGAPEYIDQITFSGVHPKTKQWCRMKLYGGLIVENIVQAIARDLLAEAMLRAETRGYTPILSVHDEVVTEIPVGFGDVKEFEAMMSELPDWARGCPVAAEGWRGFRYRK